VQTNQGKVLAVLGPTCTGKSECALWLAREVQGELVNADSMQVYRLFDIGTAKPDAEARNAVAHHVLDIAEPDQEFNAALFREAADGAISTIWSKAKVPIVVGGTGLYLRILFHGLFEVQKEAGSRQDLTRAYQQDPLAMYEELKKIDPEYARRISHRDRVRVVRAIEVFHASGVIMSEWHRRHGFKERRYDTCKIGLRRERPELYDRINQRVLQMLRAGWVTEVEGLLRQGYASDLKPFLSIGYRQIVLYLAGACTYDEMARTIQQETRKYAKRQMTWFARDKEIEWFQFPQEREQIRRRAEQFLQ
jgi:tRNA dimethylallyltransferase